jgi:ATP-binding cassette subfamily B protein
VNLIPRFYEPTRGRILLDGIPLDEYSKASLRELVGVVEQQPFLFSMTIRDNIAYGAKRTLDDAEVERAAAAAAIHDSIAAFPEGYATMVGERGVTLSGGQKQRVAIARTLVKDPALLILDDSTSAVDAETEDEIRAAMDRTMGNRTTFVVAHKVRTVMDADLILVFRDGSIVERGDHSALMAAGGFYRRAFDLQTKVEEDLEKELRHERSVS